MFVSTQIYGYDDEGLVLHLFDTAGSFVLRGTGSDDAAHFAWKDGERYKRVDIRLREGRIHSRYDAFEPEMLKDPASFEGVWQRGRRKNPRSQGGGR